LNDDLSADRPRGRSRAAAGRVRRLVHPMCIEDSVTMVSSSGRICLPRLGRWRGL